MPPIEVCGILALSTSTPTMTDNHRYWMALIVSLVVAFFGWSFPSSRMPLDYDAMISRSVPFALAWATDTRVLSVALPETRTLAFGGNADGAVLADLAAV
jgi:hypothetical protein